VVHGRPRGQLASKRPHAPQSLISTTTTNGYLRLFHIHRPKMVQPPAAELHRDKEERTQPVTGLRLLLHEVTCVYFREKEGSELARFSGLINYALIRAMYQNGPALQVTMLTPNDRNLALWHFSLPSILTCQRRELLGRVRHIM
jgi:hypothetical protein